MPGQSHDRVTVVNGKVQLGQRLKDLWINRDLLILLVRSELKVKYKGSVLGYAWSMLNPALVLAIYYVVFKIIARNHQPNFAIWLFAGLIAWNLFNGSAMGATGVVVGKAGIVKKVAFPRELLALSVVGVNIVLFAIQVVVLVLALLLFGIKPDFTFVAILPLALVALLVFTGALSIFLSAVNVYLRDTQHLTEVLLMAWFWFTVDRLHLRDDLPVRPQQGPPFVELAPVRVPGQPAHPDRHDLPTCHLRHHPVHVSQPGSPAGTKPTVYHVLPTWGVGTYAGMIGAVLAFGVVLFLLALVVFGRLEGNFAEEL